MTDVARQSFLDDGDEGGGTSPLLRTVVWGLTACGALAVAVLAAQSQMGERRVATAVATATPAPVAVQGEAIHEAANQAVLRAFEAEREAKRLAETVRALQADRDTLAGRVAKLESQVEDLTGSVAAIQAKRSPGGSELGDLMAVPPSAAAGTFRPPAGAEPARPALAPVASADPRTLPPIEAADPVTTATVPPTIASAPEEPGAVSVAGTVAGMPASEIPLPRPNPNAQTLAARAAALRSEATAATPAPAPAPAAPAPAAPEPGKRFAIEIGGPNSIDSLRGLWAKVRDSQAGEFLSEVKPAIALREGGKPGLVEMRLVAGPVASALAASRLCASVAIAGVACRATSYDGQMLALP